MLAFENINKWIEHVMAPRDELGGQSLCPFARPNPRVVEHETFKYENFQIVTNVPVQVHIELSKTSSFDVLTKICQQLKDAHKNMIFLPDHPEHKTYINGVQTNNNFYPCILAQNKKELEEARAKLKTTKYYSYWDSKYLKEIMDY